MVLELFSWNDPVPPAAELGRCHFIGIGGVGMSAIARVMAGRGLAVSGSDAKDVPALGQLRALGVDAAVGFDEARLAAADTVIVGTAISIDNPEVVRARELGKRLLHRSGALAAVMAGTRGIAVAGTNGKTTTSSMLAAALRHAGADPGYAIGGELVDTGANGAHGSGELFVAEACESDGSFVVYRPQVSIITNVQPDHLDYYGTADRVEQAFADFAACLPDAGVLVACADDAGAARIAAAHREAGNMVVTYGFTDSADVRLADYDAAPGASSFTITGDEEWLGDDASGPAESRSRGLTLRLPGEHNAANATAAYLAGVASGVAPADMAAGLASFAGTRRRFEFKGEAAGVVLYDDYAHNPPKVAAAVRTGRSIVPAGGRLVAVFQPHLYSRTQDFAAEFADALGAADVVFVTDVYPAREAPIPGVTGELVSSRIAGDARVTYIPSLSDVAPAVARELRAGDVVLTIGAGDVTTLGSRILQARGTCA